MKPALQVLPSDLFFAPLSSRMAPRSTTGFLFLRLQDLPLAEGSM